MAITIHGSGITSNEIADGTICNTDVSSDIVCKDINGDVDISGNLKIGGNSVPKVFNQTTAPTSGFVIGDIWYDTDDDIVSIAGSVSGSLQWIGV
jgi:hypothetical protein